MLLDEDPAALIHECTANFSLTPDRSSLSRIQSTLTSLASLRSTRLTTAQSRLKQLQRSQNALKQRHEIEATSHDPAAHAAEILRLDKEKFRVAKEASDLEVEGERLEREVAGAEGALREIERAEGGKEGGAKNVTAAVESDVLKLKLYRSLGIDLEADAKGTPRKAVVRSAQRGDMHVLDMTAGAGRDEYVDRFWEAM
ncbi:MAG: kinetochore-associated Ndc80 complex subunit spc24 [Chrysothrix sp. TS-e1954]|nr:MAG: kinetochore-associated Ndc80 complex subunit spc24 [Chrysothrix sp. TS-e1954]